MKQDSYRKYGPIFKDTILPGIHLVQVFDPDDFATVYRADGDTPMRPVLPLQDVSAKRGDAEQGLGDL